VDFEWDSFKSRNNFRKHGVSFAEATEVFGDAGSRTIADPDHSIVEQRYLIFGQTASSRYLVVAFTERGDKIRIISARAMTRKERTGYEKQRR
jgi:uncharacterized protein